MNIRMQDIAEMAGVSRWTVSAVLYGKEGVRVSERTREKILSLVRENDFVANEVSRQLRGASARFVGLLTAPARSGLSAALDSALTLELQSCGYVTLTANSLESDSAVERQLREFLAYRAQCVVVRQSNESLEKYVKSQLPLIYCSADNSHGFDVGSDTASGSYQAASYLLEHGYKRLLYLAWDTPHRFDEYKISGMRRALEEHGLEPGALGVMSYLPEHETLSSLVPELLKRCDALVCCNDYLAAPLMTALSQAGVKVPEDIGVVGFDGYAFCDFLPVPLATVIHPVKLIAQKTVELMRGRLERKEGPQGLANIKIPPVFRPAASCGCLKNGHRKTHMESILIEI